jgi:phospholipase C
MKTSSLISLLGLSGSTMAAAVAKNNQEPFGYKSGSKESIANMKDKIENVVWILLENRGFDNILGGVKNRGLDNVVNNGPFWNPEKVNEANSKKWYSRAKNYDSVLHDPSHSVTGVNYELYGSYSPDNEAIANGTLTASLEGFVERQMVSYPSISAQRATDEVMGYYSEDEIPTLVELVDEFTTFNYWHSCVPGVSTCGTPKPNSR